jgi:hypothetical protein
LGGSALAVNNPSHGGQEHASPGRCELALGFTPDGKAVLFASAREVYTTRHTQLFTVPVGGGFPTLESRAA